MAQFASPLPKMIKSLTFCWERWSIKIYKLMYIVYQYHLIDSSNFIEKIKIFVSWYIVSATFCTSWHYIIEMLYLKCFTLNCRNAVGEMLHLLPRPICWIGPLGFTSLSLVFFLFLSFYLFDTFSLFIAFSYSNTSILSLFNFPFHVFFVSV